MSFEWPVERPGFLFLGDKGLSSRVAAGGAQSHDFPKEFAPHPAMLGSANAKLPVMDAFALALMHSKMH
jgi:hypothetical protein